MAFLDVALAAVATLYTSAPNVLHFQAKRSEVKTTTNSPGLAHLHKQFDSDRLSVDQIGTRCTWLKETAT